MFGITAEKIRKELKKISFFVQYSGIFDQLTPQIRNTLEGVSGVEWESAQIDSEFQPKWEEGGETQWKKGSSNVKFKGKPATKMLMPTSHNNANIVGATIAPSQTKVMAMK